jgi:hypothetical protein
MLVDSPGHDEVVVVDAGKGVETSLLLPPLGEGTGPPAGMVLLFTIRP